MAVFTATHGAKAGPSQLNTVAGVDMSTGSLGQGISAQVIDMATIKPLDEEMVLKAAKECGRIVTCEEHSIIGGLGEAVCAVVAKHGLPCPVERIGANDEFGHSGPAGALLEQFGLCGECIEKAAKNLSVSQ